MADPSASINIDYKPTWENAHVQKRLTKVLDWACQFVIGNRGTWVPVRLHSKILNETFGPKGNQLGDFLRAKLIRETSNSYSTTHHRSKEYKFSLDGFKELSEHQDGKKRVQQHSKIAYVDTSLEPIERMKVIHAGELECGKFTMRESSDRLWHPLQNLRRVDKVSFWSNYLPHNYDISACAPSILYQLAQMSGMPALLADAIRLYVDTKGEFRQHVADISGLSLDDSKKLINSLFNGARLARNPRCTAYQMLNYEEDKMIAIQQDAQITQLRSAIRNCWRTIEMAMSHAGHGKVSLRKAKVKWGIYFRLERKVLNAITRELDNQGLQYFTEHDGFRTNLPANIPAIQQAILSSTKLRLTVLGD